MSPDGLQKNLAEFIRRFIEIDAALALPEHRVPVTAHRDLGAFGHQLMSRRKLLYVLEERGRSGHVLEREIQIERIEIRFGHDARPRKERLRLGRKGESAARLRVIQRFDAE